MEKSIRHDDKDITYLIHSSIKAKRIKISIKHTGQVILTKPFFMRESVAENFLQTKIDWVSDKLTHFSGLVDIGVSGFNKKDYIKHKINSLDFVREKNPLKNKRNAGNVNIANR